MDKYIIKLSNISKYYSKKVILDNISLNLKEGFVYGFTGNNGSGKSLLFKIICGFSKPTKGKIEVNSKTIGDDINFIENSGVLIENPDFIPSLSGFENLEMLAQINKTINDEDIFTALKQLGLDPQNKLKVSKYSLGMKQRLRIAQAIMEKPSILILDEPMNGLDKHGVELVFDLIKKEKEKGTTILLTSHIRDDINILCDEIFNLDEGKLTHKNIKYKELNF